MKTSTAATAVKTTATTMESATAMKSASTISSAVESTTILGGLLGWLVLRHTSNFWLALALANAGGGFFYLALHAVIGEIVKHHKAWVLANFAAGFSVIAGLIRFFHLKA